MKFFKGLLVVIVASVALAWIFWPSTWVVKGPMLDFITGKQIEAPSEAMRDQRFRLPEGFHIGLFAEGVNNARMLRMTGTGDLLVSSMRPGEVILLHRDANNDGAADGRTVLLRGLDLPHGLALSGGYLYVAETGRIVRAPFDQVARTVGDIEVIFDGLPPGGNHRTRTIDFGPDGLLYVTVGSTCNVCIEEHPYRAAMVRMQPDGSDASIFATGLRNTVGFDWQPGTGKLYGTDNGRDLLGDDIPHCEINLIEKGQFYGWPFTFDDRVVDPDYGAGRETEIANSRVMVHGLGAHVAPLGIRFLSGHGLPDGYEGRALVALHGSWNRSVLSGYKVVALDFTEEGISEVDFLTGFEHGGDVIGRPVDIEQGPEGFIYISDDYAGAIYRVAYGDAVVSAGLPASASDVADVNTAALEPFQEAGKDLYDQNACAMCHDPAEAPEGVQVKVLADLSARYQLESLAALLNAPPGPMPRADLTDDERRALAAYLLLTYK